MGRKKDNIVKMANDKQYDDFVDELNGSNKTSITKTKETYLFAGKPILIDKKLLDIKEEDARRIANSILNDEVHK